MKKYFSCFAAILLLCQTDCTSAKKDLTGLWMYAYNGMDQPEIEVITAGSFIDLHADGTYTRDFGNFDFGKWQRKDSILIVSGAKGGPANCRIERFADDEMDLLVNKHYTLTLQKLPGTFADAAYNPFAVQNNQWRIHAVKKETDAELRQRLIQHCRFYEMYFQWALNDKLSYVDVRGTPSLIKIYKNGFAVKSFDQLPETWKAYFYDEEDCRKANDMMEAVFEKKGIVWEHKEHGYKMFLSAFKQLQQQLK